MEVPKDQITALLNHGLYNSSQMLGCFLVSSSVNNAKTSPHVKAEHLVLLGDALFHEREYRRAIGVYGYPIEVNASVHVMTHHSWQSIFGDGRNSKQSKKPANESIDGKALSKFLT